MNHYDGLESETTTVRAHVFNYNGKHVIVCEGSGGPIVSDKDLDDAKEKFEDALTTWAIVKNMKTVHDWSTTQDKEKRYEYTDMLFDKSSYNYEVEWVESVVE